MGQPKRRKLSPLTNNDLDPVATGPFQLSVVKLVLQDKFSVDVAPEDVFTIVSDFLIEDMTLARACELISIGSTTLLDFLWSRGLRGVGASYWTIAKLIHTESHYYQWQFSRALVRALKRADFKAEQWLLTHFSGCKVTKEVMREAAAGGHLRTLQLLEGYQCDGGIVWQVCHVEQAAEQGHWDIVRWLIVRVSKTDPELKQSDLVSYAILQNNLDEVQWLVTNGFIAKYFHALTGECSEAEWETRTKIVHYLLQLEFVCVSKVAREALIQAAEMGDVKFAQWLVRHHIDTTSNRVHSRFFSAARGAIKRDHVSVVQWILPLMHELGVNNPEYGVMFEAIKGGSIAVIQWLCNQYAANPKVDLFSSQSPNAFTRTQGLPLIFMDAAAMLGHLEVLQVLHHVEQSTKAKGRAAGNGQYPRCTVRAMDLAAAFGHLDIVKWLHTHRSEGCTTAAMDRAAANGHLEVVQWLHLNRLEGCTTAAMDEAAGGHFHIGLGPHSETGECCRDMEAAALSKRLPILKWLHANRTEGCTSAAMDNAAASGNLEILQWLRVHTTAGCSAKAMDEAAKIGRLDIVKWLNAKRLKRYRSERCTTKAMDNAAANGHLEVVKWLYRNRSEGNVATALSAATCHETGLVNAYTLKNDVRMLHHRQLRVVRWLHTNSAGIDIMPAIRWAVCNARFDMLLYLHEHYPTDYSADDLQELRLELDRASWRPEGKTIRAWFEKQCHVRPNENEQY